MKYWSVRVLVGLGCVWGLLGVSCSSSDAGSAAAPVPIEQFPQQFSSALCDAIAPCCMDAALTYVAATCKRTATERFTDQVTAQSNPNIKYDAAAAGACLSELKSALQNCVLPRDPGTSETTSSCARIFVGTLALGASCIPGGNECASRYCEAAVDSNGGTCKERSTSGPTTRGEGASCAQDPLSADFVYCADGLYCTEDTQICTKLIPLGGTCPRYSNYCVAGAFCSAGVCAAQRDTGLCNGDDTLDACSSNSYCDSTSSGFLGQCVKKKPDGYACRANEECVKGLCNGTCGPEVAASIATCAGSF